MGTAKGEGGTRQNLAPPVGGARLLLPLLVSASLKSVTQDSWYPPPEDPGEVEPFTLL